MILLPAHYNNLNQNLHKNQHKAKVKEIMKRVDEINDEKEAIGMSLLDTMEENKLLQ